jgi:hypothetical protein
MEKREFEAKWEEGTGVVHAKWEQILMGSYVHLRRAILSGKNCE